MRALAKIGEAILTIAAFMVLIVIGQFLWGRPFVVFGLPIDADHIIYGSQLLFGAVFLIALPFVLLSAWFKRKKGKSPEELDFLRRHQGRR
jgi:hypothetical protein